MNIIIIATYIVYTIKLFNINRKKLNYFLFLYVLMIVYVKSIDQVEVI